MGKVIRLTESDLIRLVKRIINENEGDNEDYQSAYDVLEDISPLAGEKILSGSPNSDTLHRSAIRHLI